MIIDGTNTRRLNVLITGGRAPVALEWARRFAACGHRVFAAESVDRYLCRVSRSVVRSYRVPKPNEDEAGYREAIRSIVKRESIDLAVPTCEEIFHLAKFKTDLESETGCAVFCEPIETLDRLHNKRSFIELAASRGAQVPFTRPVESDELLETLAQEERFGSKLVLKPVYSRFGANVHIVERARLKSLLRNADLRRLIEPSASWIAQQYLEGAPLCSYSVARAGVVTAHASYVPVYAAGRGAGIFFKAVEDADLREWVARFVRAESFTGQISFDFIRTQDGTLYPIECNPRATSGVHLLPRDGRLVDAIAGPAGAGEAPLLPEPDRTSMLALAMLLFGTKELLAPRRWKAWTASFFGSRDIVFRRDDPGPFFEQFRILLETGKTAAARKISLLEASTIDMEWNGER
ncbi:hypothetical protein [Cohnella massiliensis]|uniref:hypothetical protein n=1 Tax=Cohnella massiliensis TaxID=1816691 RepID=UPI0009BC3F84|nr:hypothetical protein [Cohnella massiliensis]